MFILVHVLDINVPFININLILMLMLILIVSEDRDAQETHPRVTVGSFETREGDIISFILQHKVGAGHMVQMPKHSGFFPEEDATAVPDPWVVQNEHPL